MNGHTIWQRLLDGILDGVIMSLFVVFSALFTWVLGSLRLSGM